MLDPKACESDAGIQRRSFGSIVVRPKQGEFEQMPIATFHIAIVKGVLKPTPLSLLTPVISEESDTVFNRPFDVPVSDFRDTLPVPAQNRLPFGTEDR